MFYSKNDISNICAIPIESVTIALGLQMERHCCHCVFHDERNPSMHIYARNNRFHCFSCGKSGSVIDLVMQVRKCSFLDACRWLTNEASLHEPVSCCYSPDCSNSKELVTFGSCSKKHFDVSKYARYFEHPYLNKPACEFLFGQRKLHPSVIEWCRLTSWREWLQIPYFDINGQLIGVQWRNLGRNAVGEPAEPRFRFPSGSQCHIYNLNIQNYLNPGEELYISEGCSDCWALLSSGHKAIAIPSATLLNQNETGILKGLNLHMYPDADAPGENLFLQLQRHLPQLIRHPLPEGCKDYSDAYLKFLYHYED